MSKNKPDKPLRLPLWKSLAEEMVDKGIQYGQTWPVSFFEAGLKQDRNSNEFVFGMLSLRSWLEVEHGYYLRSHENGELWSVPHAAEHETVARTFDHKVRRYAVRSINLRSATLTNPDAKLTDEERERMEESLERASVRLVLISRTVSIARVLKKHAPGMLLRPRIGDAPEPDEPETGS
jgi:hypothetical protein